MRLGRTGRAWALVLIGVAALVAAVFIYAQRSYHTPRQAGVVPVAAADWETPSPAATTAASAAVPTTPSPSASVATAAPPVHVSITSIGVSAPVIAVGVHNGALDVPEDPKTLGWWAYGAGPGSSQGSVVIVGHVDSAVTGQGALFRLEQAPVGAQVSVSTSTGDVDYRIVGRRVYSKSSLPSSVFARAGEARLVLITCGGPFDAQTGHYRDNVVVYALPV